MLSYLHGFHAGNYADVQKHAALVLALRMMHSKASGIACFDTHAGSACYRLDSDRARKTAEADQGIQKVWAIRNRLTSPDWQAVLDHLAQVQPGSDLLLYPGSPDWFGAFQREQDRITAFELHSGESTRLLEWARGRGLRVEAGDGLRGLLRALPPRLPRLMVLVDPSYEIKGDYVTVADTLQQAWRRCRHGVFLIWYPVLESGAHQTLLDRLAEGSIRKIWRTEINLRTPPQRGMTGSGLLVVNPPWGYQERLGSVLADVSGPDVLDVSVSGSWLVRE